LCLFCFVLLDPNLLPFYQSQSRTIRRSGVSGESKRPSLADQTIPNLSEYEIGGELKIKSELKSNFVPRVIKKSPEDRARIREAVKVSFIYSCLVLVAFSSLLGNQDNFLFNNLEEDLSNIVFDAMELKEYKPGDVVIKQGLLLPFRSFLLLLS
jgi:hypothetical protein